MFTGAIKLANIDDYIAPSQQCVKPMMEETPLTTVKTNNKPKTTLITTTSSNTINSQATSSKATVTLNDCLACSGCVTSAESILIEQMSITEFLSKAKNQKLSLYLMLSTQSRASLAHHYNISLEELMSKLELFFSKNFASFKGLFDMNYSVQSAHDLIVQEFEERIQKIHLKDSKEAEKESQHKESLLPVLCSQCPGWVCYAEKVTSPEIVARLSRVKSPQQLLGRAIKTHFALKDGEENMYVVSIMPCFDKKLQAIRFNINEKVKEVDLVLSSQEIVDLINMTQAGPVGPSEQSSIQEIFPYEKTQWKFDIRRHQLPQFGAHANQNLSVISHVEDPKCNGYVHTLLARLQIKNFTSKQIRNSDFIEYEFMYKGRVLKMAQCYGFRNIQNVVRNIKSNKCDYVYIEIMACPVGCFNGGGQIKNKNIKPKDLALALEKNTQNRVTSTDQYTKPAAESFAEYKAVEKNLSAKLSDW